jgi:uncharacterized protein YbcV (DUF1398 family)
MITIEQIKKAHSKVKSGADFPRYIQELKALGLTSYDNYVAKGNTIYFGPNQYSVSGDPKYPAMEIAAGGSRDELARALKVHQAGGTDYPTFCREAASFGVERWTVDLNKMTCIYFDRFGNVMVSEQIPDNVSNSNGDK